MSHSTDIAFQLYSPANEGLAPFPRTLVDARRNGRFSVVRRLEKLDVSSPWGFVTPVGKFRTPELTETAVLRPPAAEFVKQQGGLLILDSCDEAFPFNSRLWKELADDCAKLKFPLTRVFLLYQNRRAPEYMRTAYHGKPDESMPSLAYYHAYLRQLILAISSSNDEAARDARARRFADQGALLERSKRFVCLNNAPRRHRLLTIMRMLKADCLDDSYVSYAGHASHRKPPQGGEAIDERHRRAFGGEYDECFREVLARVPIVADRPANKENNRYFVLGVDHEMHAASYLSIVTESEMSDGQVMRLTEKTFKPIAGGHPFIVVGNPRTLRALRDLGFQTFGEVIDESYDEIDDPIERLVALFREFDRLFVMSRGELAALYRRALPAIVHNYRHFHEKLADLIDETWEPAVFNGLYAMWERSRCAAA